MFLLVAFVLRATTSTLSISFGIEIYDLMLDKLNIKYKSFLNKLETSFSNLLFTTICKTLLFSPSISYILLDKIFASKRLLVLSGDTNLALTTVVPNTSSSPMLFEFVLFAYVPSILTVVSSLNP